MTVISPGRLMLAAVCVWLVAGAVMALDETPASQPASNGPAGFLELNRAIKAYLEDDSATAAELFERVLETSPQGEHRVACVYYLGLISLERGLGFTADARAAKRDELPDEAAAAAEQARQEFLQAQEYFAEVIDTADPTVETVSAALLLGIAQLAADHGRAGEDDAFALATRAEETLSRYVTETEYGREDRLGHFYLAVARYRLADEYSQRGRTLEFSEALSRGEHDLEQATALADAALAAEKISEEEHAGFITVVKYYEALMATLRQDNVGARQLFTEVSERAEGTDLANNAAAIIAKLDEVELSSPAPITLPVPAPVGPLEFDARVTTGFWYDSNVILLGKDTALPLGYARDDDFQTGLGADFNVSRYIRRSELPIVGESLTLGVGGSTSHVWQPRIPEFDVNRYAGRAYANWQPVRDLYLGVQYEHSFTQLGHDPFISSDRITPVASWNWRKPGVGGESVEVGRTDLYYTFDDRDYREEVVDFRVNRDGQYQTVGAQHTFNIIRARDLPYLVDYYATHERERQIFGDDWLTFAIGYAYRDEQTAGTEFDLRGHSLLWGVYVPLPYRLAFEGGGEFCWEDYTGASIYDFERKEREDFTQRYNFNLVYTIVARGEKPEFRTLDIRLRTGVELTFENSNIWNRLGEDIYEYDRAVFGVQLSVEF
ncbi:MAG: hypothetical protein JXO22_07955 [Phycisphaerae bacterium]|nr:hypothetical protein [Phycisphaerae bacterium]